MTGTHTVLVTGATGFIGSHLVPALAGTGHRVRALTRGRPGRAVAGAEQFAIADLRDVAGLRSALRGVDTVVHLAARAHVLRETSDDPRREFFSVNVEGTRALMQAAADAGVGCFVLLSSVGAVAVASEQTLTESTPPRPSTPYGESKLAAERVVQELADREGIRAPMLRPPLVYGPGMKGNPLLLFRAVARGLPLPFRLVRNRRSALYVENLVTAIRTVMTDERAGTGAYFVSDEEVVSTPELIRAIGRRLGREARLIPVPVPILMGLARAGDLVLPWLPQPLNTPTLQRLVGSLVVDASKLRRETDFQPPHTFEEGIRTTAEWFSSSVDRGAHA